jgi:N-dimethylarginine dimethylaminohydrolase
MNDASDKLRRRLLDAGVVPMATPLDQFIKSGGAAKCLTLRVSGPSAPETVARG